MDEHGGDDSKMPLPLVVGNAAEVIKEVFGDQPPSAQTGLGCAVLWSIALDDPVTNKPALDYLSLAPEVWGDYSAAAASLSDLSVTSEPIVIQGGHDTILGVKFIPFAGDDVAQVVTDAPVPLTEVWIVTVVRETTANEFRVWGLSHNFVPTVAQIYGQA